MTRRVDEAILFLLSHHDIRENDHPDDKEGLLEKDYLYLHSHIIIDQDPFQRRLRVERAV